MKTAPPTGTWKDFDLLRGVSNETLDFLSQEFTEDEVKAAAALMPQLGTLVELPLLYKGVACIPEDEREPKPIRQNTRLMRALRAKMSGASGFSSSAGLMLDQDSTPALPMGSIGADLEKAMSDRMATLRREHRKIFGSSKFDNETYCESECTCIANHLGAAIKAADPKRTVLYVFMRGGCMSGGVCPHPDAEPPPKDRIMTTWTSHEALVVDDGKGGWSFVDPLVFGDLKAHSAADWYSHFQHKVKANYYVSPQPITLGWDRPS
jgi:hypothetical protein